MEYFFENDEKLGFVIVNLIIDFLGNFLIVSKNYDIKFMAVKYD
jgi:hypothetical protein